MASLEELHDRLSKLQDGLDELKELIAKLNRAGKEDDEDGDDNSNSQTASEYIDKDTAADLAAEIADGLRDIQDDYELLQEDAVDLGVAVPAAAAAAASMETHDKARFKEAMSRLGGDLKVNHSSFRRARLTARQNLDAARRREQQEILASYRGEEVDDDDDDDGNDANEPLARHHHKHHQRPPPKPLSKTHAAAADVTAALRQTHARIAGEVARSDFAAQTLAESSRALADLGDKYEAGGGAKGGLNSSLKSARSLVKSLVAAHKSDTWYLQMALYMVVATIGWLLFRRLLYGPLWLLVLWPVRSVLGTAMWMGRTVGPGASGRGPVGDAVSRVSSPGQFVSTVTSVVTASASVSASVTTPSAPSPPQASDGDSMVEQVGRIVDGQEQQHQPEAGQSSGESAEKTEEEESAEDKPQPNPMKRMWEEDKEEAKHKAQEQKKKDEL